MVLRKSKRHLIEVHDNNYRMLKAIRRKQRYMTMPALLNVVVGLGISKFLEQKRNAHEEVQQMQ